MKKIIKKGKRSNRKERLAAYEKILNQGQEAGRIELIQMLIPLGLQAVEEELQSEVIQIAGDRYSRSLPQFKRWGRNGGSVYLGDRKVSIKVPRVRDVLNDEEVSLTSYRGLQNPQRIDETISTEPVSANTRRRYRRFPPRLASRKVASPVNS